MPSPKRLTRALIDEANGSFHLTLEVEGGEIVRLLMTEEQLDGLANGIDEALSAEDPEASSQESAGSSSTVKPSSTGS